MGDWQLLRQFIEHDSQEAFAALTAQYLNLVYSVCRRELDDAETAEDVTQAVFLILARKAPTLRRTVVLSGWLFQTARFAARNARLQVQRRAAYEQRAAEVMQQQPKGEDAAWSEIEPLLNRSLAALKEGERQCVLLRFFQGLSFAEAGAALGLSEEAARKRLTRALEKMRRFFEKGGVIAPGVTLAALLSAHAAKAAPEPLGAAVSQSVSDVITGSAFLLSEGVLHTMKIAKIKAVAGAASLLLLGLGGLSFLGTTPAAEPVPRAIQTRTAGYVPSTKTVKPLVEQPVSIDPQARRLLDQMAAAYQGLSSYSGETTFLVANRAAGVQALQRHELEPQVKMVVAVERPNRVAVRVAGDSNYVYGGEGKTETTAVSNGTDYFETRPAPTQAENHYAHSLVPADAISQALGAGGMLAAHGHLASLLDGQSPLLHVQTLRTGLRGMSDGVSVLTVIAVSQISDKAVVNNTHIPSVTTETFLIGAKDHPLRRWTVTSRFVDPHLIVTVATGTRATQGVFWTQIESFQNVKANPALSDALFTFTPPPGYKETRVDVSNQ